MEVVTWKMIVMLLAIMAPLLLAQRDPEESMTPVSSLH